MIRSTVATLECTAHVRPAATTTHNTGSSVIASSRTRTVGAFSAGASVSRRMWSASSISPKPIATGGPEIREPRIYYGEETDSYVIVKGSTPEFDYPKGKDNNYAAYDGAGGVPVGGIARRILFAWYFNDMNLLLSSYITGDSR